MGHRALRAGDGCGQLADRGRPLEDEVEDGVPQRAGHRPELLRRRHDTQVLEVVIRGPVIARHIWIVPLNWTDRQNQIIARYPDSTPGCAASVTEQECRDGRGGALPPCAGTTAGSASSF